MHIRRSALQLFLLFLLTIPGALSAQEVHNIKVLDPNEQSFDSNGYVYVLLDDSKALTIGDVATTPVSVTSLWRGFFFLGREHAELERIRYQEAAPKATEARLYRDSLTGLPNRNRLVRDIAEPGVRPLFLVNIDHFKELNDLYGNQLGVRILKMLADRADGISERHEAQAYRLHADEFAVPLQRGVPDSGLGEIGGEVYERRQRDPYRREGRTIRLDVGIGISVGSENVLARADMALAQAREKRVPYRVYDKTMETEKAYQDNLR